MSAPTIRSVADLAGVSTATVSRALTHPDKVKQSTRERVLGAVKTLGFVPNRQAVDFRRRATNTVILLVRDISNPFYLDIYRGVEEYAFEAGYRVLMGDAGDSAERISHYLDMVRNRQADGLILMTGTLPESVLASPLPLPPIVVSLELIDGPRLPTVRIDNVAAARMAVEHLIGLGHRRIAHITGPLRGAMIRQRHEGYLAALAGAGIKADPCLAVTGDFHFEAGRTAVRKLLSQHANFTAIFVSNDEMAVGALGELRAHGKRVPEDISVVGFDDVVFATMATPPLTTIRQPRREIGRASMEMMIDLLNDTPPTNSDIRAEVELVIRGSTGPAGPQQKTQGFP